MNRNWYGLIALVVVAVASYGAEKVSVVAEGAKVKKLVGGFKFTGDAAADAKGNIFFTDIPNNRIHKWTLDGRLITFRKHSGGANGLFFDKKGNLLVCEGGGRRIVSISRAGRKTILADKYNNKMLNSPHDLWADPKGGIYFTDPLYVADPRYRGRSSMEQGGEYVYYLLPNRKKLIRVIDDMVRPNEVIGTADGKTLYVADQARERTFVYTINEDGTLSNKKYFAPGGSDGMTIDNEGNIYLATKRTIDTIVVDKKSGISIDVMDYMVEVYNKDGERIETIEVPEQPSNLCFGGKDKRTLFITARTSLYSVRMRVASVEQP